ncbi:hypothetical protein ABBQ32_009633 [Trebouxia sp. C0010 RCD-2024]
MQDSSRKLLQIDDSATTVTAAPLSAAKANASILAPPSEDGKPHSILSEVISSFKSKFGKQSEAPTAAPAASATANATVIITDDEGDSSSMDFYMEPCTNGPMPSAYKAFVECICSCPVAYANGPSSAPMPAPMMAPAAAPSADSGEDMPSDSFAASAPASGECSKPVPTQYEAFTDVSTTLHATRWFELGLPSVSLLHSVAIGGRTCLVGTKQYLL